MQFKPVPRELLTFLDKYKSYYILSHIDPDGDCIGSSLAVGKFLERMGKDIRYFNPGPFGRREINEFEDMFSPRLGEIDFRDGKDAGVIVLDCSTIDRIGKLADDIEGMEIAVIDHHSTGKTFGDVKFINPTAPSSSLLVQQVIEAMGEEPNREESEYIFFAFTTDTGFFRHLEDNTQVSFQMIAKLVENGASPRKIYQQISSGVSLASRKHLGLMLQRVESFFNGRLLYTWETYEDIARYGRPNRDSDTLYQQLMNVEDTEVLLVLREERQGFTTGSIRTARNIDAGRLAEEFGGGGHARAAGFSLEQPLEECFPSIKDRIEELVSELE